MFSQWIYIFYDFYTVLKIAAAVLHVIWHYPSLASVEAPISVDVRLL